MKQEFDVEMEFDAKMEQEFEDIISEAEMEQEFDAEQKFNNIMYGHRAYYAKREEFEIKERDEKLRQTALKRKRSENFWNGFGGWFVISSLIVVTSYLSG